MKQNDSMGRRRLLCGVGLLLLAALSFAYRFPVEQASFAYDSGGWFWSALALLLFLPGALLLFSALSGRRIPFPRWLCRTLCAVVILAVLFCLSAVLPVLFSLSGDPWQEADAVILLCTLSEEDGSLSPLTEDRVRLAAAYLAAYPDALVIVSGGGSRGGVTEAEAAIEALLSLGVSEERIIPEESARSTVENFRAAKALLPEGASAVAVTSDFHAFRAALSARSAGFEEMPVLTAKSGGFLFPHYVVREWMTLTLSVIRGNVKLFP